MARRREGLAGEYDVVVVGGGGSGLACGVRAAELGASVLLLEKQAALGGTTGRAVGSFTASRTPHQRRAGIDDDPADHNVDAGVGRVAGASAPSVTLAAEFAAGVTSCAP